MLGQGKVSAAGLHQRQPAHSISALLPMLHCASRAYTAVPSRSRCSWMASRLCYATHRVAACWSGRRFRLVRWDQYRRHFASTREHMLDGDGRWLAPPPAWPCFMAAGVPAKASSEAYLPAPLDLTVTDLAPSTMQPCCWLLRLGAYHQWNCTAGRCCSCAAEAPHEHPGSEGASSSTQLSSGRISVVAAQMAADTRCRNIGT